MPPRRCCTAISTKRTDPAACGSYHALIGLFSAPRLPRRFPGLIAGVLLLATVTACRATPGDRSNVPIAFPGDPQPMDSVACNSLLSEAEVEATLGRDVIPLGRSASSCYWTGGGTTVQLVFGTGDGVAAWRDEILGTYTERLDAPGVEAWAAPGGASVAGFGPGRGLLVHGAGSRQEALALVLLALPRL